MKRWFSLVAVAMLAGLMASPRALAEDKKPLSLTVTDETGESFDLIERAGGDALVIFVDPAKFKEEDAKDLVAALDKIAKDAGEPGEAAAEGKAILGLPGVVRLEENADAKGKDSIQVVMVFLTADKDVFAKCQKEMGDPQFQLVMADPAKEDAELKAFELPENLVWAAFVVIGSEVKDGYTSVKDLEEHEKGIADDLNK